MMQPENIGYARLSQVLGTFFIFFLPALSYQLICHGKKSLLLSCSKHLNGWQVLIGFFLIFLANIIAGPLAELSANIFSHFPSINSWGQQLEHAYSEQVTVLSNLKSWSEFLIAIFIMALFPALFEEMFFRGALQNLFEKWWRAPFLAVLFTSILFSLIHMSLYLFLSRALLGFILGVMYQRSKNLWVNIIAHFLNNTVALIQLFWISMHSKKIEIDKMDPKIAWWGGLIAVGLTYGLFILFENVSAKNRKLIAFAEQDLIYSADHAHYYIETEI